MPLPTCLHEHLINAQVKLTVFNIVYLLQHWMIETWLLVFLFNPHVLLFCFLLFFANQDGWSAFRATNKNTDPSVWWWLLMGYTDWKVTYLWFLRWPPSCTFNPLTPSSKHKVPEASIKMTVICGLLEIVQWREYNASQRRVGMPPGPTRGRKVFHSLSKHISIM